MATVRVGSFAGDPILANELRQGLFHGLHPFRTSGLYICAKLMVISAAYQISDPAGSHQDLHRSVAINAVHSGQESLVDDRQQGKRELATNLGLKSGRENIEYARDGLGGVVCMQGCEDQMTRLGSG